MTEELEMARADQRGSSVASAGERPLRADALKNRQLLLDAAEDVFATDGVQAQVDLVAQRAGVGVGTLYRHFPTKEALLEAIVRSRLEALCTLASDFAGAAEPGSALLDFLHEFGRQAVAKRDLFEALGIAGVDIKTNCADSYGALKGSIGALLERAQGAGSIRSDVGVDDVIGLIAGACMAASDPARDADWIDRIVDIVCDGLRVVPR